MSENDDETRFKTCLQECIQLVKEKIGKMDYPRKSSSRGFDSSRLNIPELDTTIHTFSIDSTEHKIIQEVTEGLERILKSYLPSLDKKFQNYLLDLLHSYGYRKTRKFINVLNLGNLKTLLADLDECLASLDAFRAAWQGDKNKIAKFLKEYPAAKDKTGVWGTTLLYSAARNNHYELVKYLITKAQCSVNAQNRQHIKRALATAISSKDDFENKPSSGSTALHGACFNGHLEIVKLLVSHKADYFKKNHIEETPIMNAGRWPDILDYFREILILGYSSTKRDLPNTPILEDSGKRIVDCVWEYAPVAGVEWRPFSTEASAVLQKSLIVPANEQFKHEIHLKVEGDLCQVSLIEFLQSGKHRGADQKLAWIRCRGSSIANFDCYALWQIMFTKHPQASSDRSLGMLTIPTVPKSGFKLKLNSWYFCDAKLNDELDEAMKCRRRKNRLDIDNIKEFNVEFDLQKFSFTNDKEMVSGYVRWVPKMISNHHRGSGKIISVDEFHSAGNMNIIPLTVAKFKQILRRKGTRSMNNDEEDGEDTDEDDLVNTLSGDDDDDDDPDDDTEDDSNQVKKAFFQYESALIEMRSKRQKLKF